MKDSTSTPCRTDAQQVEQLVQLQEHLMRRFLFTHRSVRGQTMPIPVQEVRVLFALAHGGPASMGALARDLVVSVSSLTATVSRLVERGLVARGAAPEDRRVVRVELTPAGRERYEERRQGRLAMARAMLGALRPSEQQRFLRLMRKIVSQTHVALLAAALLLPLASGCRTVQQARAVQKPDSMGAGERTVRIAELGLDTNALLSVAQAVRLAITNSPEVFQARVSLAAAERRVQEAHAAFLPTVGGSAGFSRSGSYNHPAAAGGGHHAPADDAYNAGLRLNQTLLSFGRNEAALQQALAQQGAAAAQLRATVNAAAYGARLAFFDLVRAQDLLVIAAEKVREFAAHLEQTRVMAELGTRIRYDITKAEVDLGNARLDVLAASNSLLTARVALGRALGLAETLPPQMAAPPPPMPVPEDAATLFREARRGNPELVLYEFQSRAASAGIDLAVAGLYPDLSLGAAFSWSGATFPLSRGWSLGPSAAWNLFDGWNNLTAIEIAAFDLQLSRSRLAGREQQLFQDLTSALIQLQTAHAQAGLAEVIIRSARESLDLVAARYKLGLATAVELTDAEVAVAQARTQRVQARYAELAAQALILRNLGVTPAEGDAP